MSNFQTSLLRFCLSMACLFGSSFSFGQTERLSLQALRISETPQIDGKLDESVWTENPFSDTRHFIQSNPFNGLPSRQKTQVHILYDDEAIYIGAHLFDEHPDSIYRELGLRDETGKNTDRFVIGFDPYLKGQNAFVFVVTAAGVQGDRYLTPEDEDLNWNVVWFSAIQIHEGGWTVEIEIPYTALRFPKEEVQHWGLNFSRRIQRYQETAWWNYVNPQINGVVNQFGLLEGLKDIKPPPRISISPYLSAYALKDGANPWGQQINGGMDLKYGINESFTLDLTLVPDFGQVLSDDVVLNLSPFEVRFNENRPFFTEGTELFNKWGLFYSRRIGQVYGLNPDLEDHEILTDPTPTVAPLINASKLSGRTAGGLGLGFFNAITNRSQVNVLDTLNQTERLQTVDPLTNYNVLVADQNLKNNSTISIINTNVSRSDGAPDANVTGAGFSLFDKSNTWNLRASGALSQIFTMDADQRESLVDRGYTYSVGLAKVSGNWIFDLGRTVETDNYNPNDMGFLRAPNEISHRAGGGYQRNQPIGPFNSFSTYIGMNHTKTYEPREFDQFNMDLNFNAQWKNFWFSGMGIGSTPVQQQNHFEARVPGYIFRKDPSYNIYAYVTTDSRKRFQLRGNAGFWRRPNWNQIDNWFFIRPRFRFSNRLTLEHSFNFMKRRREIGFVTHLFDTEGTLTDVMMGKRDVLNITNVFSGSYTFNDKMGLNLRVRHYWSKVQYDEFYSLSKDGYLLETPYTGKGGQNEPLHDANFNAFSVDLVYSWQFAPGSFLNVVWKNNIYTFSNDTSPKYWQNLQNTWQSDQINSISARLIYYLDYQQVKSKIRKH